MVSSHLDWSHRVCWKAVLVPQCPAERSLSFPLWLLQIDAVSLFLLYLVEMICSGLQIIYNTDEVSKGLWRVPRQLIVGVLSRCLDVVRLIHWQQSVSVLNPWWCSQWLPAQRHWPTSNIHSIEDGDWFCCHKVSNHDKLYQAPNY